MATAANGARQRQQVSCGRGLSGLRRGDGRASSRTRDTTPTGRGLILPTQAPVRALLSPLPTRPRAPHPSPTHHHRPTGTASLVSPHPRPLIAASLVISTRVVPCMASRLLSKVISASRRPADRFHDHREVLDELGVEEHAIVVVDIEIDERDHLRRVRHPPHPSVTSCSPTPCPHQPDAASQGWRARTHPRNRHAASIDARPWVWQQQAAAARQAGTGTVGCIFCW